MMDHTPLDVDRLSPAAQKALGPGPGRMMAARGLLPLPPAEQVTVLYQLSLDSDTRLAEAARATAAGLPDKLLAATLGDPKLDPRVLDLFAGLVAVNKAAAFEALMSNHGVADETIAMLASRVGADQVDRLAGNEQRLLRHPEIIAAMYLNKAARMSTVDRVVELAVRNHVRVPGLAAWDEIAQALKAGVPPHPPGVDDLFNAATALTGEVVIPPLDDLEAPPPEETPEVEPVKDTPLNKLTVPAKIRIATLGNAFQRSQLIRDPIKLVAMAAIKSPGVSENEARAYASKRDVPEDVIRFISLKREWTKSPAIQIALCYNPKTPLPEAVRLLQFLRPKQLVNITRSKGVPSALVAQARRLISQRSGGEKK
jgi:hypothetical protein